MTRADDIRAWVLENVVLEMGDRVAGHGMMRRLRDLRQIQWWEPERIRRRRDQLLRRTVKTAYSDVPFYRDLLDGAGVRPEEIRTPEDLDAIPVVTKEMLRAAYPHRTTRDTGQRTYETSTSGSTGKNFYVREDPRTAGWRRASFMLALGWSGWRAGEPHLQFGITYHRNLERRFKDRLLRTHYAPAAALEDRHLDDYLRLVESGVRHVWGYPASIYYLARRALDHGRPYPLSSIVTWGDNLYPAYRTTIQEAFGCKILDTYGCGEGIQVAAQCREEGQYHIHELDVIPDCVDSNGQRVPPGEAGTLVLTRLTAGPMPFLRYRVGDVGILEPEEKRCACGRGFRLLREIQGRDTDAILTPGGNRLVVHYFTGIMEHFHEIDEFQVLQDEPGAIRVRVVPAAGYGETTSERVIQALRERAPDLKVSVEPVPEIPLTPGGKRRFVIRKD